VGGINIMKAKIETRQVAIDKQLMICVNIHCASLDIRANAFIAAAIKTALDAIKNEGD
tara:strand:+ start:37 stop:210 length:174 start_codon:yes stop_codon:yes gene_type:complete